MRWVDIDINMYMCIYIHTEGVVGEREGERERNIELDS